MKVPFGALAREQSECGDEVRAAVGRVLASGWFVLGAEVARFEKEFSEYLGGAHVVGVGSGTEALHLALLAAGVGPGDRVVTVPNTAVPTVSAISAAGARPVFVDVDERSLTMDPAGLRELVAREVAGPGRRLRAVIPVHLYGQTADMDPIIEVATEYGLTVIEDAAQAHGAVYRGRRAGTLGDLAAFSFYPSKNLGCYGDGGAVVTADGATAERLRMLRNYGQRRRYHHEIKGVNSRLDEIQAAVLSAKLPFLDAWNVRRRQIADTYARLITNGSVVLPVEMEYAYHVRHLFPVRHEGRDRLATHLATCGVATAQHYPVCVHLQRAYGDLGLGPGAYPVAEAAASQVLSLPIFPQLSDDEVAYVGECLNGFAG
jgi:dTDP-4-amino-4,6-dideoxygalactose transaminase